jgi:hypothetical protein
MAQVDQALRRVAYDIGYKVELIGVLEAEVDALREGRTQEADGLRDLWCEVRCNRGDGGDPFPGDSGNPAFSFATAPAAIKNIDSSFVGSRSTRSGKSFRTGDGFQTALWGLTLVQASDTTVPVLVDAAPHTVFRICSTMARATRSP